MAIIRNKALGLRNSPVSVTLYSVAGLLILGGGYAGFGAIGTASGADNTTALVIWGAAALGSALTALTGHIINLLYVNMQLCPCPLKLGHCVATDDRSERWPGSVIQMRIS